MTAASPAFGLKDALQRARARGHREGLLAALAAELGKSAAQAAELANQQLGIELDSAPVWSDVTPMAEVLPITECRRLWLCPVRNGSARAVFIDDPWAVEHVQRLAEATGGLPRLVWSNRARIQGLIDALAERGVASPAVNRVPTALEAGNLGDDSGLDRTRARTISVESMEQASSAVVRFVDERILDAWKAGASDIHFETTRDGLRVKYRLNGVLVDAPSMSGHRSAEESINRIKVLAQLDISETRIPQDGRFRASVPGREIDFRVSVMPSIFGEDAVIRLLDKAQLRGADDRIDLKCLGFDDQSLERIRALALEAHGMLLVTGPTGSGKTTTLYAVLSELNRGDEKIVTIEDPVEYELPGVLQIPVNEKKGLTFARGLRSILRHDPDKILVGEIRDPETAEIAVQAALTGHLVFTTVHANNVYDVVGRFLHMEVDLYGFVSALNGIVAQRLIRLNCPACARNLRDALPQSALQTAGLDGSEQHLKRGAGCVQCRGTGYSGRTAVAEVVPVDHTLRELIVQKAPGRRLREHVRSLGITALRTAALRLVLEGRTTLEEVRRVVGSDD
jgi:general secretion pathway protein E